MTGRADQHSAPPPHEDPARCAARLVRLVERQHGRFVALDALSERQRAAIDAGDADALLTVLGERQTIVDDITAAGEEMAPFNARWDELVQALSSPDRAALAARVAELQRLSLRVADADERDRVALESRRASLVDDIAGVVKSRGAIAAYGPARPAQPRFHDREG
ncbi:MAG: hypothetical protein IBJ10_03185 [Phycisphaerales bacterium]|nr:hypothetical protein [Phycisphaerales bacterium]